MASDKAGGFVVDSSVFIAFYYKGDTNHENAVKILSELDQRILIIHPYVIQETATVLTYKFGQSAASRFLSDLEKSANIIIPVVDIKSEIKNFSSLDKKISFTDATLIALAKQMNGHLVTFDKQMLKLLNN